MNAMMMLELLGEELMISGTDQQGPLPPGFRFHPTDEELITYYLASKVFSGGFCGVDIVEVDLNRCEPWELPDVAKMGEREWYFFSLRDRKYPTGLRTNRATGAGYWKATGKDREVHAAATNSLVGMKKTLVFYKGRAPRGEKTKWVLHEYRLEGDYSLRHTCKEEWVICRIFNKSAGLSSASSTATHDKFKNQPFLFDPPQISSSPAPSFPAELHQTLENPIQSLLQSNNPFLVNHNPNPYPVDWGPPQQEDDREAAAYISNWLDVYLQQNPGGIYELAFGSQLLPLVGPTASTVADFGPSNPKDHEYHYYQ